MPSGTRRTHTKSRNGCSQCKARRKRCDQKPPRCGNCQRWGIVCDYTALSIAVQRITNKTFVYSACYWTTPLAPPAPSASLDFGGLKLLQHYATRASLTLSAADTQRIWQVNVPGEAKTHIFLMHSLLALSALHLSCVHLEKRDRYFDIANQQHERALRSFSSSVTEVTAVNGSAVTAFSLLTIVFSLGLPVVYGFASTPNPTSSFIDIIQVLRQAWYAMDSVLPEVERGALGPLFKQLSKGDSTCPMHIKGHQVLAYLQNFNETSDDSEEHKAIYRDALMALLKFFTEIRDTPPLWGNSLIWPTTVSDEFFELLREQKPFALVLLAHWCIPVYRSPSLWFNMWAKNMVADILTMLNEEDREAVTWPAEQVGLIPQEMHTASCMCLDCCPGVSSILWEDSGPALLV